MMRKVIYALAVIATFVTCKKTPVVTSDLSGKYQTSNVMQFNPPVMYVLNRQITDTAIIKNYLRYHNAIDRFNFNATGVYNNALVTIEFNDTDTVNVKRGNAELYKAIKSQYSNDVLAIQRIDSLANIISPVPVPTRCDSLQGLTCDVTPVVHITLINGSTSVSAIWVMYDRFPLIYQDGLLALSMVTSAVSNIDDRGPNSRFCFGRYESLAIKKVIAESNLRERDTIVIQDKKVKMIPVE